MDSKHRNVILPLIIKYPSGVLLILDNQSILVTEHVLLLWLHNPFHLILFVEMYGNGSLVQLSDVLMVKERIVIDV